MNIRRDCIHYHCEHEMGASIDCCSLRGLGKCPCSEGCAEYANRAEVYKMGLEAIKSKHTKHMIDEQPTIGPESQIIYSKAGYIMSLHKEYGCTLTRAEEAHNKALEYLRDKAMMKG